MRNTFPGAYSPKKVLFSNGQTTRPPARDVDSAYGIACISGLAVRSLDVVDVRQHHVDGLRQQTGGDDLVLPTLLTGRVLM